VVERHGSIRSLTISDRQWIYDADQWMWASRFEQLIADQDTWSKTNMLEIVTWNGTSSPLPICGDVLSLLADFGESHYLNSPHSDGDVPPTAGNWTNGFDHSVRSFWVMDIDLALTGDGRRGG
jgi:glucan endo-1,3-alpha-glucosidase